MNLGKLQINTNKLRVDKFTQSCFYTQDELARALCRKRTMVKIGAASGVTPKDSNERRIAQDSKWAASAQEWSGHDEWSSGTKWS